MKHRIAIFIGLFLFVFELYSGELSLYTQMKLSSLSQSILKNNDLSDESSPCYVHFSNISALAEIENLGVEINNIIDDIAIIRVPYTLIQEIAKIEGIERIEIGTPVYSTLDNAREYSGVDYVHDS